MNVRLVRSEQHVLQNSSPHGPLRFFLVNPQDVVVLVWVGIEDSALRTIPPLVFGKVKLPVDIAHESLGRELHMSRVLQTDVPVAAVVGVAAIRIASCEECLRRSPSVGMHRVVVQVSPP